MSHIYQPVMLIELLQNNGSADVNDIAKALLIRDQSQTEYYERITKNMVGRVLTKNRGITTKTKNTYALAGFGELSAGEIDNLVDICLEKINDYVEGRGSRIWSHRKKSAGVISGTIRYEVLKDAKFRCELCGISAEDKALEVDHILPRNSGGTDDRSNLQALCYSCNAMKRDRDDTDFRGVAQSYQDRKAGCIFCDVPGERIIAENELCYAVQDAFPVTDHHTLVIPKRHVADFFELYRPERNAIHSLLAEANEGIKDLDGSVSGFNVGINSGEDAGQTIFHCHVHLIPRRKGDIDNPRGGVRGIIPAKRNYPAK
jgi:diadenosine tetraphosphate (Ap4A) HIT family hydrolase/5-methylcytosine-specific restriction endonuclease McrA